MIRAYHDHAAALVSDQGDLFHFHPRATNPELWRTTIPLVVRERCGRHKGLVATWLAIHWLIVLHAASGRAHFGMREIAEEAGVGRNELAGPTGHIQRLVGLGLLRIVGYKSFKNLREPRPVYHVDLIELERQSLDLVPDVLRDHHIDRPPPAAPDPRQLQLFALPAEGDSGAGGGPALPAPQLPSPIFGTAHAALGEGAPVITQSARQNGTGETRPDIQLLNEAPGTLRGMYQNGTDNGHLPPQIPGEQHENGTGAHENGQPAPESRQEPHANGTDHARNRDVDRANERTNEGESQALTPNVIQTIAAQVTQAVLKTLGLQGRSLQVELPSVLTTTPPPPDGYEPLPAPVLALWQGDEPTLSRRETHQLAILAAEYDPPTGGHGAYWLGRAILMADLCLSERGQPRSLAYLRRVLRRWREEGSWGSDRETSEAAPRLTAEPHSRPQPVAKPPAEGAYSHPAVRAYVEALHETPNAVQAAQIAGVVIDLDAWGQVLKDWQLNGWGERSVGKMLDRYQKTFPGATATPELPPSVAVIHTYPGLTLEQRERWIRKFHAAATPVEKRAVISRLEQEHPQ